VVAATLGRLTYRYPGGAEAALTEVSLELGVGLAVVAGPSGGGKSTLLRVLNGLVPHFHGGRIAGQVQVGGLDVLTTPTRRLAREVGFVFQDPEQQAVYTTVDREVAFGLENIGFAPRAMPARVDEALEAVGARHLRGRRLATLSGGERQRVAVAAALAVGPRLLVLDEPTSQLDAQGTELVVDACLALARDHAVAVSEHRLERLLPAASLAVLVESGRVESGAPAMLAPRLASAPAIVRLGVELGWNPLPLTVAAAAARAPQLRGPARTATPARGEVAWSLRGVAAGFGPCPVVEGADLEGRRGEVVVLMGPNGGGKTTLLRTIAGLAGPAAGVAERGPGRVAYLPQNPSALLHRPTVRDEVELTLSRSPDAETAQEVLAALGLESVAERYPRDLSTGQRQRAALAAVLAGRPALALLDEPTRGMDAAARAALATFVHRLASAGGSVVVATHDSDLAAEVADRVVLVDAGRVRELGAPDAALAGAGPLATQIGRLYPGGPVTVAGVLARL
jgi:energy-coupling factor transport system ATP-binding protein